ncbi:phosphoglycolate phosphatase [Methylibium sp. Root1272]|uniref:phosphoglycolate phosphatase n=1 Tax=Methylibium sp. Root1272 TaxID=1736441 RepID=UPI000ADCAC76|nr:phosphoglycolate phosphatase [Methylibium sp. Root1272]
MPPLHTRPEGLEAAIVDLDGTLVDTLGDFVVALDLMLGDLASPRVDRGFVERTVGKGSEHLIARTLAQVGAAAALYESAWARYQHHYAAINGEHAAVYPGAAEGLQRLGDAGLRLACLTNKPQAFAQALLERKGLSRHFVHVFGGDAFERKKPDPLPLLRTCAALGTAPAQTLMLGDSSNDAQAARAAGCPVVLVTYGYNHGEPVRGVDADGYVDRIDELVLDRAPRGGRTPARGAC